MEDFAEFIFNFLSNHKKDLQLSNIPLINKFGYVDIEDFFKKGIDVFKKKIKEDDIHKEDKTLLETYDGVDFQIVKFEKSFNPKDYPTTIGILPKIISSVLTERMKINTLSFKKKMVGMGLIERKIIKDYFTLSEGDVINIKTNSSFEESFLNNDDDDKTRFITEKIVNFITTGLNFNFTFLIELDPL